MGARVVDDTVRALHVRPSAITQVEGPMLEVQKVGAVFRVKAMKAKAVFLSRPWQMHFCQLVLDATCAVVTGACTRQY